jgi:hypothetical protein
LLGSEEELVAIEQSEGAQMALGDEPDLALGVGQHEIAFAGLRGIIHAQHFVDELGIEAGVFDGMRAGNSAGFEWVKLDI